MHSRSQSLIRWILGSVLTEGRPPSTTVTLGGMTWALRPAPWCLLESQRREACPRGTGRKGGRSVFLTLLHRLEAATGPGSSFGDQRPALGAGARTSPSLREARCQPAFTKAMHVVAVPSPHGSKLVSSAAGQKPPTLCRLGPHAPAGSLLLHRISCAV